MANSKYNIREICGDWALDIQWGKEIIVLVFNSRNNAELVKKIFEWEDMHPNQAVPYMPAPHPCKPLTLDQLREMDGQPVWVVCLKKEKYIDPPIGWRILEKSISGSFGVWNGENCLSQRSYSSDWFAYSYPPAQQRWIKEANTPPTNGDRIRTMDNKELSEWLYSIMVSECCDMTCPGREFCEPGHKGLLDWLQATYKEE